MHSPKLATFAVMALLAVSPRESAASQPVITFAVDASSVSRGTSVAVRWSASGADNCSALGPWSTGGMTSGVAQSAPLGNAYSVLGVECVGAGGVARTSSVVDVTGGDEEPAVVARADATKPPLSTAIGQRKVRLVPLADGRVIAAYSLGYPVGCGWGASTCIEAPTTWHMVLDRAGIAVPPQRTWQQLDVAGGLNPGSLFPSRGGMFGDGGSAIVSMAHSGHNNLGGNFVRIDPDGAVLSRLGGTGSYGTEACVIGSDVIVTAEWVDPVTNGYQWWESGNTLRSTVNLGGYGFNYLALQGMTCGFSNALGGNHAVMIRKRPGAWVGLSLYSTPGPAWTAVGPEARLPTSASNPDYLWAGGAASGDDKGVVMFRDTAADGRRGMFYARYRITPSGAQFIDAAPVQIQPSTAYEGLDGSLTYGGDGVFYLALYQGGASAAGQPVNGRQAIRTYALAFESGSVVPVGAVFENGNWSGLFGSVWDAESYSVAKTCDGNLYVGGTIDGGSGRGHLQVLRHKVAPDTCLPTVSSTSSGPVAPAWSRTDVSVQWHVDSRGRPVLSQQGCSDAVIASDTSGTLLECSVTTPSGSASASTLVKRDATPPEAWTFLGSAPTASGWFTSPVTVNFAGSDATSGIASCSAPVIVSSDGANQSSVTGNCTDVAGNVSTPVSASGLNIDVTAPTLVPALTVPANALGWHKAPVTVSFPGTDAAPGSGIRSCSPAVSVSTEITARIVSGSCSDVAGNSTTQAVTINLDKTLPGITITRPVNGASYAQGLALSASFKCTDSRSGVSSCVGSQATGSVISTSTPGSGTFTVDATDKADNTSRKTATYTILPASYALSPAALAFGGTTVGQISAPQVITLSNTGQAALPLTSIKVTGTSASSFALTHACPGSIAPGASCPITVSFKPSSGGAKVAAVTVTMSAGDTKVKTVGLSGTGVAASYSLSPTSISFGSVAVGNASSTRIIGLTNTGTVALPITSILLTGTNPGDFVSGHTCGSIVAAGAGCQISVSFQPGSSGSKTARVTVTAGAGASTRSVSLSGAAMPAAVSVVVNVDAISNATSDLTGTSFPVGASAVRVNLPAGSYTLTPIGPTQGGLFTAQQFCTCNVSQGVPSWYWILNLRSSESPTPTELSTPGNRQWTAEDALAAAPSATVTLGASGWVEFMVIDSIIGDNAGGVSLRLQSQ